jgi:hypothetical protein
VDACSKNDSHQGMNAIDQKMDDVHVDACSMNDAHQGMSAITTERRSNGVRFLVMGKRVFEQQVHAHAVGWAAVYVVPQLVGGGGGFSVSFPVCMYVCMYVGVYACRYFYMYVCKYICMYVCMYVWMHVCMDACMYVCM